MHHRLTLSYHIHPQKSAYLLSRILLHLGGDVTVGVQGEACGIMPRQARQGLHIHTILEGQCSEGIDLEKYFEKLKTYIAENPPDFGDGESVLTLLYETYAESNRLDDGTIKEDFNELYRQMNGMELQDMDKIIYPLCTLCRDH